MAAPLVPTIDLGGVRGKPSPDVVRQVADAGERFGFFQVVNHGIADGLTRSIWEYTERFFAQDAHTKRLLNRTKENSRGYYDRELTKNARDLKEVLDLAQLPFPELPDDDPANHHEIDGFNQWPAIDGFRSTIESWLQACNTVSLHLLSAFCMGLDEAPTRLHHAFDPVHTSFLRMNHYPLDDLLDPDEAGGITPLGDMALHHHSDAGALTVLLQDDVGGLQVAHENSWIDVAPIPGALVVNTGDMMQVWSNDRYRAALHRVLPRTDRTRYSLPYFFNPSYTTDYAPLPGAVGPSGQPHYDTINWGAFRQARADGDYADYGAEVQISDFRTSSL
jgi:isopenicillin N synthase-like dioxygenase